MMTSFQHKRIIRAALGVATLLLAVSAMGQTVSPPIAEYRGKASGMVELRNDGDEPLAAILEVRGFQVDEQGALLYVPLDPKIKVDLGANSFVIPPHQSHFVFYKASSDQAACWFAILSTLTRATNEAGKMRINFILPHVVYVYQKSKLKRSDLNVSLNPAPDGSYALEIANLSEKLGRVQSIDVSGFEKDLSLGGIPVFPAKKRFVDVNAGPKKTNPKVNVVFEDGFSISVPVL
jgi:hypothetical protein